MQEVEKIGGLEKAKEGLEKAGNVKKAAAVGKGVSSLTEKVGLVDDKLSLRL